MASKTVEKSQALPTRIEIAKKIEIAKIALNKYDFVEKYSNFDTIPIFSVSDARFYTGTTKKVT